MLIDEHDFCTHTHTQIFTSPTFCLVLLFSILSTACQISDFIKWETGTCAEICFQNIWKKQWYVNHFCINHQCRTEWEDNNTMYKHKFHYQLAAQCLYLLYNAPTRFGCTSWPSLGAMSSINTHSKYGNLSSMTTICTVYIDKTCSSLKTAKMYGWNMQEHCIININIVQLAGSEICVY